MGYFITFLAGMGFAALVDFTVQLYRKRRDATSERIADRVVTEVFAVDPTSTQVGNKQMARLRKEMGI